MFQHFKYSPNILYISTGYRGLVKIFGIMKYMEKISSINDRQVEILS